MSKKIVSTEGWKVFKLVCSLVNREAHRDPEKMPDISLKIKFLLVFWRNELLLPTGQDLVPWILKAFEILICILIESDGGQKRKKIVLSRKYKLSSWWMWMNSEIVFILSYTYIFVYRVVI
jgi:hypothetical protein